jgi:hypothetical protein
MAAPNQKLQMPRIPGGAGAFAMRRSHFLDSTIETFYGPGQPPDSGAQPGADDTGAAVTKVYQPPLDWPGAGRLLRVPQVVFLSPRAEWSPLGQSMSQTFYFTDTVVYSSSSVAYTNCSGVSTVAINPKFDEAYRKLSQEGVWTIGVDTPDVGVNEYQRLYDVFAAVKTTIEGLRPGRTWVDLIEWDRFEEDGDHETQHFGMNDTIDFLLAPPLDEPPYLGTRFLHIYAGSPWGFVGTYKQELTSSAGAIPPEYDTAYTSSSNRVMAAYGAFAAYAAWVYSFRSGGVGLDWSYVADYATFSKYDIQLESFQQQYDTTTYHHTQDLCPSGTGYQDPTWILDSVSPPGGHSNPYTSLPNYGNSTYLGPLVAPAPLPPPGPGENYGGVRLVDTVPVGGPPDSDFDAILSDSIAQFNQQEDDKTTLITLMCTDLADYGVTFEGATSLIDHDYLVNKIAAFFGFDPATGEDLS